MSFRLISCCVPCFGADLDIKLYFWRWSILGNSSYGLIHSFMVSYIQDIMWTKIKPGKIPVDQFLSKFSDRLSSLIICYTWLNEPTLHFTLNIKDKKNKMYFWTELEMLHLNSYLFKYCNKSKIGSNITYIHYIPAEMEKAADAEDAIHANFFTGVLISWVLMRFS